VVGQGFFPAHQITGNELVIVYITAEFVLEVSEAFKLFHTLVEKLSSPLL